MREGKTTFLLAVAAVAVALAARAEPVPTLHVSDLFRPHDDPDDHWDLATQYALAWQGRIELLGVMTDYPRPERTNAPDVVAVAQLNRIAGKAVPLVVGSPRCPAEDELRADPPPADLAGIRAFLDLLRKASRPAAIHIIGSSRDVALALRLDRELFARNCAAIYLNAGSGTPDPAKAQRLEWNVNLDPANYAAIFEAPCPVYWLPCFEVVHRRSRELLRVSEFGSFYRFRQEEILPRLSARMQNYFLSMYAAGDRKAAAAGGGRPWQQQLDAPVDAALLAAQAGRDRNMWCTAGFLNAAGLAVTKAGEVVPRATARDPVFVFEPIRVQCTAAGVTTWSRDPTSTNRFLLRVTDVERYGPALTAALKTELGVLP